MTVKEKIEFIDDFLARCEDWMHGDDGIDVTEARKHLIDIEKHLEPTPSTECAMHDVVGQSEQLKCQCKKAKFTRTVDADFNPLCGRCGKAL